MKVVTLRIRKLSLVLQPDKVDLQQKHGIADCEGKMKLLNQIKDKLTDVAERTRYQKSITGMANAWTADPSAADENSPLKKKSRQNKKKAQSTSTAGSALAVGLPDDHTVIVTGAARQTH